MLFPRDAGYLLTRTDDSMAQIAEAVGYESEAALRDAFSKVVGQPPGQVRRSRAAARMDG